MTLVALTQEPEVKVRLAMIGKWCLNSCRMITQGECDTWCTLYDSVLKYDFDSAAGPTSEYLRCPACIVSEPWWRCWLRRVTGSAPAHHELVIMNRSLLQQLGSQRAQLQVYRETICRLQLEQGLGVLDLEAGGGLSGR